MTDRDLAFTPAYELANQIARKKLSPVELARVYLRRIEELNPKLNAYLTVVADQVVASAQAAEQTVMDGGELGPLHGVPIAVKDMEMTAGIRTTYGSLIFKDHVPDRDSAVVERIRKSGGCHIGQEQYTRVRPIRNYGEQAGGRLSQSVGHYTDDGWLQWGCGVCVSRRPMPLGYR